MTRLGEYRHDASEASARRDTPQQPDPRPGAYFVSVIDPDSGRAFIAAGPWPTHAAALAAVAPVRSRARELSHRASESARRLTVWGAFGTCRLEDADTAPGGPMNDLLPADHRPPARPWPADPAPTRLDVIRARRAAARAAVTGTAPDPPRWSA